MSKLFQVLVIDPPWTFSDKLSMDNTPRGANANYSTMTIEELKSLPIKSISDPNGAILALWTPSSLLQEGLDLMKVYGFRQTQTYIWVKTKIDPLEKVKSQVKKLMKDAWKIKDPKWNLKDYIGGISDCLDGFDIRNVLSFYLGHLFRQTHEICLIGINSTKIYKRLENRSQRSVSFCENMEHSKKPEALQDSLEFMFPQAEKIEIFARRQRKGWICLGNEIDGKDIRDALKTLI